MKSKNIPDDIKEKSMKEAQNEVKQIILELEQSEGTLDETKAKYERMLKLNHYIEKIFKQKAQNIKNINFDEKKKIYLEDYK